jgi:ureidoacrylate peracid hydrolase
VLRRGRRDTKYARPGAANLRIDPGDACLFIIDMQNAFANPGGSFAKHGRDISLMEEAIPTIARAKKFCRSKGIPVLYTRQVNVPHMLPANLHSSVGREVGEWTPARTYLCLDGTWDSKIVDELKPAESDMVVEKNKTSAFYSAWTEVWLRQLKVKTIIVTGCTTGMCVLHTSMEAFARDYDVLVVEDGVGDQDAFINDAVLEDIDRRFGRVLPWAGIEKVLSSYPREAKLAGHRISPGIKVLAESEKTYLRKSRE